ncbi:MAG: hypothetical protein KKB62_02930 [Nanoarchaeota archaeon]|nr:hypothetical protein [Nanoarchaeota archaeon]
MEIFFRGIFIFILSLIFALLEIEIEGPNGWARKLPTWYRKSGFFSKVFYNLFPRKPLTGYHFFVLPWVFLFLHFAFFIGLEWTIANEIAVLISFSLLIMAEDFLWFIFNPYFGVGKFKREKIWWHSSMNWFFKHIPMVYLQGIFGLALLVFLASFLTGEMGLLYDSLMAFLVILVLTFISMFFVPTYKKWYIRMRKIDESSFFKRKIKFKAP